VAAAFFNDEGYREVSAVRNHRIYYFPCDLTCRIATNTGHFVAWLSARIYRESYAEPKNQIQPDGIIDHRNLTIDLPYIKRAHIVRSRIADFLHKTLIIDFSVPQTILSTLEGQRSGIAAIGNHSSPPPYWGIAHQYGLEEVRSTVYATLGRSGTQAAILFTGADMDHLSVKHFSFKDLTVCALVTAGVRSNAVRTSRDEGRFYEPGTINILLLPNARLSPRAMSRAIITATEAKTAALADMDVRSAYLAQHYQATGTGTDNIIVAEGTGVPLDNAGGHSKMGELIAKAVYQGVQEAVYTQNGLVTDRHIFARLRERHISPYSLVSNVTCDCLPDTSMAGKELETVLLDPRYAGFLEAAFAVSDDDEAGLLADTQAFERWCGQVAADIAGRPLTETRELVPDDGMPRIQRMALNAILNGVYGRLIPAGGAD
jgi:adenosylcobinamide amidohydrolase